MGKHYCDPVVTMKTRRMDASKQVYVLTSSLFWGTPRIHGDNQLPDIEITQATGHKTRQKSGGDSIFSFNDRTPSKIICRVAHTFAINQHDAHAAWVQKVSEPSARFMDYAMNTCADLPGMQI